MQPNQEIKDPHPPANGETVADVPAEYGVHCRGETQHTARREENFDELLRVPGIDEPEINVHRAVHRTFVSGEQAFGLARTVEHFVKSVSAFFATEYGKKNSAAKDRIDESGGIACKQPSVAVQKCAAIGKVRFQINF